jgi:hypothetical protein
MRTGVSLSVTSADMDRLRNLVKDRNAPQKHVWRALASDAGIKR